MNVKIKFCGIKRLEDISYVNETKPDYAGFILSHGFRRTAEADISELTYNLDDRIKRVGVFVNEPVRSVLSQSRFLDVIQLHGDEDSEYLYMLRSGFGGEVWKAVRLRDVSDIEKAAAFDADKYVLDAFSEDSYGGTGTRIDEALLEKAAERLGLPYLIAGGINADNIAETVRKYSPFGIDISSGTETEGIKDINKMRNIMNILREEGLR